MGVFDRLSLAAAEAAMRTIGPRAGLRAFRSVIDRLAGADRARAILLGLDCATQLGDRPGLDALIARWRVQSGGDYFPAVARRCVALRSISTPHALRLAEMEVARRPDDARPHYLLGRLRGADGLGDLRRALRLAERAPAQPTLAVAIRDRLAWLGEPPEGFDRGGLAARARLGKARADLTRGGRYARVAALDVLIELAEGALRREALALAAAHAERATLTTIEVDRLRSLFGQLEVPAERERALAWLDAREALDRGTLPAPTLPAVHDAALQAHGALERGAETDESSIEGAAFAVIARATSEDPGLAEAARALLARVGEIDRGSEPFLAATALAAAAAPEAGEPLARHLLGLPQSASRGWLRLAVALRDPGLRELALARAVAGGEPGAARARALTARSDGWRAFRARDEVRARELLALARAELRGR